MCDIITQSVIFGLVNGVFSYSAVYLLCSGDTTLQPNYCPSINDVNVMNFIYGFFAMFILYFVVSWITKSLFGENPLIKILLLTLIAVFGVILYMSYIGKPQNVSLLSLAIMLVVAYLVFWIIEVISGQISLTFCGPKTVEIKETRVR